jgi:hypothetical protein
MIQKSLCIKAPWVVHVTYDTGCMCVCARARARAHREFWITLHLQLLFWQVHRDFFTTLYNYDSTVKIPRSWHSVMKLRNSPHAYNAIGFNKCGSPIQRPSLTHRPDEGGSKHIGIVGALVPDYTAQHARRQASAAAYPLRGLGRLLELENSWYTVIKFFRPQRFRNCVVGPPESPDTAVSWPVVGGAVSSLTTSSLQVTGESFQSIYTIILRHSPKADSATTDLWSTDGL